MRAFWYPVMASALLFGCATEDQKPAATAPVEAAKPAAKPQAVESKPVTQVQAAPRSGATAFAALKDPNNILSKRTIYFDFDKFDVKDEFKPLIEAHAKYLAQNRNMKITLQGHTDERGSREYNIALGQKRAEAVKRMMILLGATEVQIETVSFGKEKPRNMGHDEPAWAENRRDEIIYVGE